MLTFMLETNFATYVLKKRPVNAMTSFNLKLFQSRSLTLALPVTLTEFSIVVP